MHLKIWDDALGSESFVRYHTLLDVFMLQGEVLETVISGGTSDIGQFVNTGSMIELCLGMR